MKRWERLGYGRNDEPEDDARAQAGSTRGSRRKRTRELELELRIVEDARAQNSGSLMCRRLRS